MRGTARRPIQYGFPRGLLGSFFIGSGGSRRFTQRGRGRNFGDRRRLDSRSRLFGKHCGARFRFRVLFRDFVAENPPQFDGDIFVDRAGVGVLLG